MRVLQGSHILKIAKGNKIAKRKLQVETTKICIKCNQEKSISLFRFKKYTQKHMGTCIDCEKLYHLQYRKNNKEKIKETKKEIGKKYYIKNKEKIKLYAIKNKEKIKETKKNYFIKNKEYFNLKHKEYSLLNKDTLFIKRKEYYLKNKELIKKKNNKYYVENKKNIAIKKQTYNNNNKDKSLERARLYRKTQKGQESYKNNKHKRRSLSKSGDVTIEQLLELRQNAKICYWCETNLKNVKVHIDHYIPLSKGGLHTISNLVISCSKCNLSKGSKSPLEFANSKGKLL